MESTTSQETVSSTHARCRRVVHVDRKLFTELAKVLEIGLEIARRIRVSTRCEVEALLRGLEGGFIEPGPSGALTRGKVEVLPTGRNFYAVDPRAVPTEAAWKVGVEIAEKLVRAYLERHGRYPESIGVVLWSIDAYKADGEMLAAVLYLLGVRPVWDSAGYVKSLEVIPLEELGRPRIDVVVRISGIVRDTLPNYVYLIDEAVRKVISLDEPPEMNYIRKHYLEFMQKLLGLGMSREEADELAAARVFAEPPGAYGAGVNYAVEASAWRDERDLARVWIAWSSYMYTRKHFGKKATEALILNLERVDIIARNHPSDEHDIFGCCCYFAYHGGFYNAAKVISGKQVEIVQVDTTDLSSITIRDMQLEIERIVRAKLLNPFWIENMRKHGYTGASEIQRKILHLYGWAATTRKVPDWVFAEIAKTYVLNPDMRKWFLENNKYALEEITRRLIEAAARGVWSAPEEVLQQLRQVYAEIEASLESEVSGGEIQGGAVQIVAPEDDEEYAKLVSDVDRALSQLKGHV